MVRQMMDYGDSDIKPINASMLKSIFYIAGVMLAGLWVIFMPHRPALAATDLAPTITSYQPTQVLTSNWPTSFLTVIGTNFPKVQNGLTVLLRPSGGANYIQSDLLSYTPDNNKIVVQTSAYLPKAASYDLKIMAYNGAQAELLNAIQVTDYVTPAPSGGNDSGNPADSPILPPSTRPAVSFEKSSDQAPAISNYTPTQITAGPVGGVTLNIEGPGNGWPGRLFGLAVNLINTTTGQTIPTTTFSYTPQVSPLVSRLIVETLPLQPTVSTAYDIAVIAWNGHRTLIRNGLWYEKI